MSYKTGRGNVAKKCLRFHAAVRMVFDYQSVTKYAVAASRQLAPEASPPPGLLPAHGLSVNVFLDDTFDVARK